MKRTFACLALWAFVALHSLAIGKPHTLDLVFEKLELKNGRTLAAGKIRSYDPSTGRTVVFVSREVVSLQIELLPDELQQRIVSLAPSESREAQRELRENERREESAAAEQRRRELAEERSKVRRQAAESDAARVEGTAEQLAQKHIAAAKRAAYTRADRYYRYEMKLGSGATFVVRRDIELTEPEAVPGWENRYRIKGTIGLEFFDSRGSSFSNALRSFEVIVKGVERGNAAVLDFTPL